MSTEEILYIYIYIYIYIIYIFIISVLFLLLDILDYLHHVYVKNVRAQVEADATRHSPTMPLKTQFSTRLLAPGRGGQVGREADRPVPVKPAEDTSEARRTH